MRGRIAVAAIVSLLCPAHAAVSQEYEWTIKAPLQNVTPVLDGVIGAGEYAGTPLHVSFLLDDDENPGRLHPQLIGFDWEDSDEDLSYDLYAAHTSSALHLGFRVFDDILDIQDIDWDTPWENDAIELFVNADNDPEDMTPADRTSTPEGFQIISDALGNQLRADVIPFQVGTKLLDDGYVIEFRVPFTSMDTKSGAGVTPPSTGSILGFEVGTTDNDRDLDNNQDTYGQLWRLDGEASGYGCGEPCWHVGLELSAGAVPGDFDGNGSLGEADITALSAEVQKPVPSQAYDLNGDKKVDQTDRTVWVHDLKKTYFGDANFNGLFNSDDFVQVFQRGEYEDAIAGNSTWSEGDWDGNANFDSADFVKAFQDGGYEAGPRPGAVSAVPEPGSASLCLIAALGFCAVASRRRDG